MTQTHFPTLTHPDFVGKTGAGDIADAMAELDPNVGVMLDVQRSSRHLPDDDRVLVQGLAQPPRSPTLRRLIPFSPGRRGRRHSEPGMFRPLPARTR